MGGATLVLGWALGTEDATIRDTDPAPSHAVGGGDVDCVVLVLHVKSTRRCVLDMYRLG